MQLPELQTNIFLLYQDINFMVQAFYETDQPTLYIIVCLNLACFKVKPSNLSEPQTIPRVSPPKRLRLMKNLQSSWPLWSTSVWTSPQCLPMQPCMRLWVILSLIDIIFVSYFWQKKTSVSQPLPFPNHSSARRRTLHQWEAEARSSWLSTSVPGGCGCQESQCVNQHQGIAVLVHCWVQQERQQQGWRLC